jgi:hypothetical protein
MEVVSFEIAKKLKEKGYPQKHMGKYDMLGPTYIDDGRFYENGCITEVAKAYSAPTISQVLKWLREEKKIYVLININFDMTWFWDILGINTEPDCFGESDGTYQSYKQAALAGIKYCLDNLI